MPTKQPLQKSVELEEKNLLADKERCLDGPDHVYLLCRTMGECYYIDVLIGWWKKENIDIQDQKHMNKQIKK